MDNTSWEVQNLQSQTVACVNSHFVVVTEEEILQMLPFLECVVLSQFVLIKIMLIQS